ncbi:unnamed protein product [Menidia menidia]|uniref:(Atlantic silverside) hypothetical protein n=1 Tax=Menidia menidia TaxID=238744 RepID=A0A8S4C119_9TELE|nr:unnamed protein product [Menidia menidia]
METTDWDVFRTATTSLDEYTETVTSYISFCEDCCIPSRTRVSYNNDKPWFSPKLRQLRLQKEEAFRSGDRDRFKESKYRFSKAVRDAKRLYSENLKKQFSANDSASVWKGLRQITNYKPKSPHSVNDLRLANELNDFYCRFERQWDSPNINTIPRHHQPLPSCTPIPTSAGACPHPQLPTLKDPLPSTTMTLSIQERDVSRAQAAAAMTRTDDSGAGPKEKVAGAWSTGGLTEAGLLGGLAGTELVGRLAGTGPMGADGGVRLGVMAVTMVGLTSGCKAAIGGK